MTCIGLRAAQRGRQPHCNPPAVAGMAAPLGGVMEGEMTTKLHMRLIEVGSEVTAAGLSQSYADMLTGGE